MNEATKPAVEVLPEILALLTQRGSSECVVSVHKEGVESWSAGEIADLASRFAAGLIARGVEPEDRVALVVENQPPAIAALLGVLAAGAVAVPIDAQFDRGRLDHVLSDSGARLVLTASEQQERMWDLEHQPDQGIFLLDVEQDDRRSWRQLLSGGDEALPELERDQVAILFYTSGTTGPPKGVPLTHRNLAFQIHTVAQAGVVQEDDRVMLPLPLHHVYPLVIGILVPLSLGLPIIVPSSLTGPEIFRALQQGEVSVLIGVPRLYSALYEALNARARSVGRGVGERAFEGAVGLSAWVRRAVGLYAGEVLFQPLHRRVAPRLRVLASGGSPLDPELGRKLEGVGWKVAVGYGLTETSPLLTINPPGAGHLETVGEPIAETEIRTEPLGESGPEEDAQREQAEQAEAGEILARGPGVFGGYWNLPEKTQEVFTEDGWYRTGDLGYLDDHGRLHVAGRASTQIVTEQGENVQPDEVEEAYAEAPEIREIGVLQREGHLVAVIVPERRQRRGDEEIDEMIRRAVGDRGESLPSYQQVSDYVLTRSRLPRTRLGKIRRHELKERFEEASRGEGGEQQPERPLKVEEMSAEDRSLLEHPPVRRVWDWLAERYHEDPLTLETSFELDLGVDSMGWMNLTMEIIERTGAELGDDDIAAIETVRDLLERVQQNRGSEDAAGEPLQHPEQVLSDRQQRLLLPLSRGGAILNRGGRGLNRVLIRRLFHLRVEGVEQLPGEGPFVIAPNHLSHLDPFVVAASLDRQRLEQAYWAAWVGATHRSPFRRWLSRYARTLPIDPSQSVIASLALGAAVLRDAKILVWFPEGERSEDGQLQPFKPGLGLLLDRYRVPVVPALLSGTYEAMPPGSRFPWPRPVTLRYGRPLDPDQLERQGAGDQSQDRIVAALHQRVAELGG